jgi:hypothetical protein
MPAAARAAWPTSFRCAAELVVIGGMADIDQATPIKLDLWVRALNSGRSVVVTGDRDNERIGAFDNE